MCCCVLRECERAGGGSDGGSAANISPPAPHQTPGEAVCRDRERERDASIPTDGPRLTNGLTLRSSAAPERHLACFSAAGRQPGRFALALPAAPRQDEAADQVVISLFGWAKNFTEYLAAPEHPALKGQCVIFPGENGFLSHAKKIILKKKITVVFLQFNK